MSKHFGREEAKDAAWALKSLKRTVEVADKVQSHPRISDEDKAAEMRDAQEAAAEALAMHPQSENIRAFVAERGW